MDKYKDQVLDILNQNNGREIDIAYRIYMVLKSSGEFAPKLMKFFFEKAAKTKFVYQKGGKRNISDKVADKLSNKYSKQVGIWLDGITITKPSVNDFYKYIWDYIQNNEMFEDAKTRAFIFYRIWMDPRIPYYEITDGIKIDDKEFSKIFTKISKAREKAKQIAFSRYSQRAEEASVLLNLISEIEDEKEKVVLLAYIIRVIEIRTFEDISRNLSND